MNAPAVDDIVTLCGTAYVPAAGEKVQGAAVCAITGTAISSTSRNHSLFILGIAIPTHRSYSPPRESLQSA